MIKNVFKTLVTKRKTDIIIVPVSFLRNVC